eukprot:3179274-Alexandrium_andersonii.AAC.1
MWQTRRRRPLIPSRAASPSPGKLKREASTSRPQPDGKCTRSLGDSLPRLPVDTPVLVPDLGIVDPVRQR